MTKTPEAPPAAARSSPPPQPDYERWGAEDLWTQTEAAALLMGWEPMPDEAVAGAQAWEHFTVIRDKLQHDTGKTITYFDYTPERGYRYYPWVVIEWAESGPDLDLGKLKTAVLDAWPSRFRTGAHLAERDRLKQRVAALEIEVEKAKTEVEEAKRSAQPAYLDEDHKCFAQELRAAVTAWTALFEPGQTRAGTTPKRQLEQWLRETYNPQLPSGERLGENAIARVATVANPRKVGGAPRTPEKT